MMFVELFSAAYNGFLRLRESEKPKSGIWRKDVPAHIERFIVIIHMLFMFGGLKCRYHLLSY